MSYFIALVLILMLTFNLCFIYKRKFEVMFAISSFSIIIFTYLFGFFQILSIGMWLLLAIITTTFISFLIITIITKNKSLVKLYFTPISIIFMCFCVVQFGCLFAAKPFNFDELSHWALSVKNMFYFKDFGNGAYSTEMFKGYPPATSLFLYFFQFFGRTFQEGQLYMAMNVLNIGLILPVFSLFKKQSSKISFVTCLLTLFVTPLLLYGDFFRYLYVDPFLGLIFAYTLFAYFKNREINTFTIINISLALFVLTLAKNAGLFLSVIILLIILTDILICNKKEFSFFKNKKINLFLPLIPIAAILISKLSWSLYLNLYVHQPVWGSGNLTIGSLFQYLFNPTNFQSQINANFWLHFIDIRNVVQLGSYSKLPPFILCVVIALLLYYLYKKGADKKTVITLGISAAVSIFIWLVGMLISYVFTFSENEALSCASYYRYILPLMFGFILFIIYLIFKQHLLNSQMQEENVVNATQVNRKNLLIKNILISTLSILFVAYFTYMPIKSVFIDKTIRNNYIRLGEFAATLNYQTDSIYYINVNLKMIDVKIERFVTTPVDCNGLKNGGSYGIGVLDDVPESWGDPFNNKVTKEKLQQKLSTEYNYLYLYQINDAFIEKFGDLFQDITEIQNDKFYKTNVVNGKLVISMLNY